VLNPLFILDVANRPDSAAPEATMIGFLHRLLLHYAIYRRYPLRPLPALANAWKMARS
jgi:hypothetical protein